ncbi:MAG: hypothetical protein RR316_02445 [Clostridia bacterium]
MFKKKAGIKIAVAAFMTATLTLGKLSLSWLPNIEIVTLLLFIYTAVFGWKLTMLSAFAFVLIEGAIYGFLGSWWICYLIYFTSLPLCAFVVSLNKKGGRFWYALCAAILTFSFDILTVAADTLFYGATFYIRFLSGIYFFAMHVFGNFAIFLVAYLPLKKLLFQLKFN